MTANKRARKRFVKPTINYARAQRILRGVVRNYGEITVEAVTRFST